MEELRTKAVVLRAINYHENDKLLTIFSLEKGKIIALLKGCNKPDAKLKFASQPFCFAEFSLVQKGNNFVITNASEIESFFDITKDYDKLVVGMCILEICDLALSDENVGDALLFLSVLNSLKLLCFEQEDQNVVLTKFLLDALKVSGYGLDMQRCQNCKNAFDQHIFLDTDIGAFVCHNCKSLSGTQVSKQELLNLELLDKTDYQNLKTLNLQPNESKALVQVLALDFQARFSHQIKSLKNF